MRKCPRCGKIYEDSEYFCFDDGAQLAFDPSTPVKSYSAPQSDFPTQVIPQGSVLGNHDPSTPRATSNNWVFPVLGVLSGLVVVLGAIVVWMLLPTAKQGPSERPAESKMNTAPSSLRTSEATVTVNSPGDGYLALKDRPCIAPCGATLVKIPHGTNLVLGGCVDRIEVADNRSGRWCSTSYAGRTGWVFDAFVIR